MLTDKKIHHLEHKDKAYIVGDIPNLFIFVSAKGVSPKGKERRKTKTWQVRYVFDG